MERYTYGSATSTSSNYNWLKTVGLISAGVVALIAIGWFTDSGDKSNNSKMNHKKSKMRQSQNGRSASPSDSKHEENEEDDSALQSILNRAAQASKDEDLDKAEENYLSALEIVQNEKQYGPDHPYVALISYSLAVVLRKKGELDKAEKLMVRAIEQLESSLSEIQSLTDLAILSHFADALGTLGDLYIDTGRFDLAEPRFVKAIEALEEKAHFFESVQTVGKEQREIKEKQQANTAAEIAVMKDNYARLKWKQKKYKEAERLGKEAVQLLMSVFGPQDPLVVQSLMRLATVYLEQGKSKQADEVFNSLIQERADSYGGNSVKVAALTHLFGLACFSAKNYISSLNYFLKAKSIYENDMDLDNSGLIETVNDLVAAYAALEKYEESETELQVLVDLLSSQPPAPSSNQELPKSISKYLKTVSCALAFDTKESKMEDNNLQVSASFLATLEIKQKDQESELPEGALLQLLFEDPSSESSSSEGEFQHNLLEQVVIVDRNQKTITVQSPKFHKTETKLYVIRANIYSDKSKKTKIGFHHLFCYSWIDTTQINSVEQLQKKLSELSAFKFNKSKGSE